MLHVFLFLYPSLSLSPHLILTHLVLDMCLTAALVSGCHNIIHAHSRSLTPCIMSPNFPLSSSFYTGLSICLSLFSPSRGDILSCLFAVVYIFSYTLFISTHANSTTGCHLCEPSPPSLACIVDSNTPLFLSTVKVFSLPLSHTIFSLLSHASMDRISSLALIVTWMNSSPYPNSIECVIPSHLSPLLLSKLAF